MGAAHRQYQLSHQRATLHRHDVAAWKTFVDFLRRMNVFRHVFYPNSPAENESFKLEGSHLNPPPFPFCIH